MSTKKLMTKIEKFLGMECTHNSVKRDGQKFCPDCGKKVTVKHVCIKCMECGHLRNPVKSDGQTIKPEKKYCSFCGSSQWTYQYYYDSTIPDKLREISVKQVIEDKENPFAYNETDNFTDIWIEPPVNNGKSYKSNVIKANRNRFKF